MSSPQPFIPSSQLSGAKDNPTRSKFTYRQLAQLAVSSTTCPLRVIAHLDLDAFYAQCEMVRLNLPEDTPLAVQQWYDRSPPKLQNALIKYLGKGLLPSTTQPVNLD